VDGMSVEAAFRSAILAVLVVAVMVVIEGMVS
jgi:hypothetical protein